ncbi:Conserved hypothetical secreted protein [Ogataea parapolymorpha DL-1]|uniref:Conserved hypothetical secreted protein n=1 Tax=Ogataea parapolymorpha (strain ATCC 26012 / BCRC 20466 / JCM 22074 / NRRL Y-7560 / DL-1) TaxID=871575 RepID=W1Q8R5_OGAPD|nr:Conserved hypothetical secreted protein [Ogataea parapolymorpha DL-1]ESW96411.1 Conserved hypothetical secreted protein [Ogataea parapolymorpha DL-1]
MTISSLSSIHSTFQHVSMTSTDSEASQVSQTSSETQALLSSDSTADKGTRSAGPSTVSSVQSTYESGSVSSTEVPAHSSESDTSSSVSLSGTTPEGTEYSFTEYSGSSPGLGTTGPATYQSQQPASTAFATTSSVPTTPTPNWLPTSIVYQDPSTASGSSQSSTSSIAESALPKAISPVATAAVSPNYKLITVGFKQELNYPFVCENSYSSNQIFEYLPKVLTYPNPDVNESAVFVKQLVPYSSANVDYIITVAEVYFDQDYITVLQNQISNSSSTLYTNPDAIQKSLATYIDSRVPIKGLLDATSVGSATIGGDLSGTGNDEDDDGHDSQSLGSMDSSSLTSSGSTKVQGGRIAGIVAGSAAGATAYAAVMVLIYKRRKKKLQEQYESEKYPNVHGSGEFRSLMLSSGSPVDAEQYHSDYSDDGAVRLTNSSSGASFTRMFTRNSNSNVELGSTRYMPSISNPTNVKNSLGW